MESCFLQPHCHLCALPFPIMSKTTKIILGAVAAVIVLCIGVSIAGGLLAGNALKDVTTQDPDKVRERAAQIAEFTVPAGFEPAMAVSVLGVNMPMYINDRQGASLFFIQVPAAAGANADATIQNSIDNNFSQGAKIHWSSVGDANFKIRGAAVVGRTRLGELENGTKVKMIQVPFAGKGGPAAVLLMAPESLWDQKQVDAVLASIK